MGVAGSNRRGDGGRRRPGGSAGGSAGTNGGGAAGAAGAATAAFRVTIPSDFNAGRDVQERILEAVHRYGYNTDSEFAIRIALEEAMVNAIKHGNRLDPAKKVYVESHVTPRRAEITIEDEGPGFDRSSIPDPCHDDNLHKPSGRGILLIETYMDAVQWSRGGRRLKMVKENQ
jgi:serine/threonine-protein kinase RsbW